MTHNPFSASRIAAGQLAYRYPPETHPEQLLKKFIAQGNWGTLVGPHGVGKTTLALDLVRRLWISNLQVFLATIRQRPSKKWTDRFLNRVDITLEQILVRANAPIRFSSLFEHLSWTAWNDFLNSSNCAGQELWVVDGVERLSLYQRSRLVHLIKNRRAWGIITLHSHIWLKIPKLLELQPNLARVVDLAEELLQGYPISISRDEISEIGRQVSGNPRKAFDRLYDLYEMKQTMSL